MNVIERQKKIIFAKFWNEIKVVDNFFSILMFTLTKHQKNLKMSKCIKVELRKTFLPGFKYTFYIKSNQMSVILLLLTEV